MKFQALKLNESHRGEQIGRVRVCEHKSSTTYEMRNSLGDKSSERSRHLQPGELKG